MRRLTTTVRVVSAPPGREAGDRGAAGALTVRRAPRCHDVTAPIGA
ncbi:MAG TPA: hypothetical protein VLB47_12880 [Solirubrobacteraceae bacterium]|nr:hypothetical protein [Solirubrobacteraceae bacterium]